MGVVVEPILEIVGSLGLGALMGLLLHLMERFFHSRSKRMAVSVAFVLLMVGLSYVKFTMGSIHMGFSLLLVCMMAGTVFCNVCPTSEELMSRVDKWSTPLSIVFFALSGAELDLQILTQPLTLLVGFVYILARSAGKYLGAFSSCRLTGCNAAITRVRPVSSSTLYHSPRIDFEKIFCNTVGIANKIPVTTHSAASATINSLRSFFGICNASFTDTVFFVFLSELFPTVLHVAYNL